MEKLLIACLDILIPDAFFNVTINFSLILPRLHVSHHFLPNISHDLIPLPSGYIFAEYLPPNFHYLI